MSRLSCVLLVAITGAVGALAACSDAETPGGRVSTQAVTTAAAGDDGGASDNGCEDTNVLTNVDPSGGPTSKSGVQNCRKDYFVPQPVTGVDRL